MVRKAQFTRDDVITAGVSVVAREGMSQLSARKVAEELRSSTAPVYSNFENMEELGIAVREAIVDQILDKTKERHTEDEFLNIGIGVLKFARQEPGLYSAIFVRKTDGCSAGPRLMMNLLDRMAQVPQLASIPDRERIILLNKMGIFTHGLAVMVCNGSSSDEEFRSMIQLMDEVGRALVQEAASHVSRTEEEFARLGPFREDPQSRLDGMKTGNSSPANED